MSTIRTRRFKAGRAAIAACLAIVAACAIEAPRLAHAIGDVGGNFELPLERIAADDGDTGSLTAVSASPGARRTQPLPGRPAAHVLKDDGASTRYRRAPRHAFGYRRTVSDPRYWT
jgi:hypothetical protein